MVNDLKYKEFDGIQVLFKPTSFFSALTDKIVILKNNMLNEKKLNFRKSHATRLKKTSKMPFIL